MIIRDWDALNATEMPQWIVGLTSKDEKRQFQAKMKLSTYLGQHALALNTASDAYNQVLETDAPVLLTSLLIAMLKDQSVANPRYITELLEIVISFIKEPTLKQTQRKRAEKIYERVAQEFNVYLDILKHPDSEVRIRGSDHKMD